MKKDVLHFHNISHLLITVSWYNDIFELKEKYEQIF